MKRRFFGIKRIDILISFSLLLMTCKQIPNADRRSKLEPGKPPVEEQKYGLLQHSRFPLHDLTKSLNVFALSELPITWKKYLADETFTRIDEHLKTHNGEFPIFYHAQGRINRGDCQEELAQALDLNWGSANQDIQAMVSDIVPRAAFGLPLPNYGTIIGLDMPKFTEENVYQEDKVTCVEIECLKSEYENIRCGEYNPITHNSNTSYVKALRACGIKIPGDLKQYENYIGLEKAVKAVSVEAICQNQNK